MNCQVVIESGKGTLCTDDVVALKERIVFSFNVKKQLVKQFYSDKTSVTS